WLFAQVFEEFLDAGEEALAFGVGLAVLAGVFEFAQQFLLTFGQVNRRHDYRVDVHVAAQVRAQHAHALAAQAELVARLGARRNLDRQGLLAPDPALPAAGFARLVDRLPRALAGGAGLLSRVEALLPAHTAVAVAGSAARRASAGLGAASLAAVATNKSRDADRRLLAAECLFQRDFEIIAEIAAAGGARLGTAATAHRAEHLLEDVGETTGEPTAEVAGAAAAVFECGMAEPIIGRPLLIVLQDVIGFVDVLEFLLGRFIAGIAVGVILHCELAVGPLQLVGIRRTRHPENVVKVLLCHSVIDARSQIIERSPGTRLGPGDSLHRMVSSG